MQEQCQSKQHYRFSYSGASATGDETCNLYRHGSSKSIFIVTPRSKLKMLVLWKIGCPPSTIQALWDEASASAKQIRVEFSPLPFTFERSSKWLSPSATQTPHPSAETKASHFHPDGDGTHQSPTASHFHVNVRGCGALYRFTENCWLLTA